VLEVFREIQTAFVTKLMSVPEQEEVKDKSSLADKAKAFVLSNDFFIPFKFFELINQKYMTNYISNKNQMTQQGEKTDDALIKKINSISSVQTYFTQIHSLNGERTAQVKQSTCFYKMLKCESKLIRFLFELNGLVPTDRHDWNVLWTHTQGKSYFYERLNPFQKVNHFPVTIELTRKDRLAANIRRMQEKHSPQYFNFLP